jgi:response regulator RpfG family c-di-GMP phosphodiesterase
MYNTPPVPPSRRIVILMKANGINRKDRTLKGKTLVVNDEASIRELFSTVFTEADYEVIAAKAGKSATTN